MNDDLNLLQEYARNQSEPAFRSLVTRHADMVYSVALRQVGVPHLAQEVTQTVFIILARKAGTLDEKIILPGWLCRTARYAGSEVLRQQRRRRHHEQEAAMQPPADSTEPAETWLHISPHLEDAMHGLGQKDHDALVLRFFQNKNFAEVSIVLGVSEDAAKMRVGRALDKLRKFFIKRGLTFSAAMIAGAVSANSVSAAPTGMAVQISMVAGKGLATTALVTSLVQNTMKTITWIKLKLVATTVLTLFVAGTVASIVLAQPQPTLYAFLERPPLIVEVSYERDMNPRFLPKDFPAQTYHESNRFVMDGSDFCMTRAGGPTVGRFGELYWSTAGEQLTKYDARFNEGIGKVGGLGFGNFIALESIHSLLTAGIVAGFSNKLSWDAVHKQLALIDDEGKEYRVAFKEENNLPVVATIRAKASNTVERIIVYHYDSKLCGGKFPAEIVRYVGADQDETNQIDTLRIKSLKLPYTHFSASVLNPDKFIVTTNQNYMPLFYSNNVLYWTDANGKTQKVLDRQGKQTTWPPQ